MLIVIETADAQFQKSARNLPGVTVLRAGGVNVYDVLRHSRLLMTKAAATAVAGRLGGEVTG